MWPWSRCSSHLLRGELRAGIVGLLVSLLGRWVFFWKTALRIFLIFGMKLLLVKGKKVTEPDSSRKFRFSGFWAKRSQNGPKWPKMVVNRNFL